MVTVYGIRNCDTVKRARTALEQAGIDYRFHDLRVEGLTAARAQVWIDALGLEAVLNRRGTTWRQLAPDERTRAETPAAAALLAAHPSLVRRPVFDRGGALRIGFAAGEAPALLDWLRQA